METCEVEREKGLWRGGEREREIGKWDEVSEGYNTRKKWEKTVELDERWNIMAMIESEWDGGNMSEFCRALVMLKWCGGSTVLGSLVGWDCNWRAVDVRFEPSGKFE